MKSIFTIIILTLSFFSLTSCKKQVNEIDLFIEKYKEFNKNYLDDPKPTWVNCENTYIVDYVNKSIKKIYTKSFTGNVTFDFAAIIGTADEFKLESKEITLVENEIDEVKEVEFILKENKAVFSQKITNKKGILSKIKYADDVEKINFYTDFIFEFRLVDSYDKFMPNNIAIKDNCITISLNELVSQSSSEILYKFKRSDAYFNEKYKFYKVKEEKNGIYSTSYHDISNNFNYVSNSVLQLSDKIDINISEKYDEKVNASDLPYINFSYPFDFDQNKYI